MNSRRADFDDDRAVRFRTQGARVLVLVVSGVPPAGVGGQVQEITKLRQAARPDDRRGPKADFTPLVRRIDHGWLCRIRGRMVRQNSPNSFCPLGRLARIRDGNGGLSYMGSYRPVTELQQCQSVRRLLGRDQEAGGSNPLAPTKSFNQLQTVKIANCLPREPRVGNWVG
jgi:hypothetical protein